FNDEFSFNEDKQESIQKTLNPIALIGNIFTYGIGYVIDYFSGGLWDITKKTYDVELKPKQ
ncbi:MAG: hypothetical protein GXO22_04315, partial [Aquificae bacterium]|nr:hypothetical protein [Aquificota bacterium]